MLIVLGYFVYKNFKKFDFDFAQFVVGIFLFFVAFLMFQALTTSGANSGVIGGFIVSALKEVIGAIGTAVAILMIFIISLGLAFRENFIIVLRKAFVDKEPNGYEEKSRSVKEVRARQIPKIESKKPKAEEIREEELIDAQVLNDDEPNLESEPEPEMEPAQESRPATISGVEILNEVAENKKLLDQIERGKVEKPKDFVLPPLKFLNDPPKRSHNINEAEIDQQISNLLDKLRKFKIDGDVVRTYTGPIVTTFEFRPAPHIKVSKILTLQDDLAMALKAQTIRIQAPIPGKDVVGIEVPNQNLETIYLKKF